MTSDIFGKLEKLIVQSDYPATTRKPAEVLVDNGSPSTSIAILDKGEIVSHVITSGRDDSNTLFQACSISKAMNALLIIRLVEEGHFNIEDKICDLLPQDVIELLTQDKRTERLIRSITVKQLMSHTSGLSVGGFPGYPDHSNVPGLYDIIRGKENVNTPPIKMVTLPGWRFMYSGGGIEVLRCMIEHVMKKPFPSLMSKYVFEPLEMTRSCYKLEFEERNVTEAYYTGYTPCESSWHAQPELAAAGLWTTPTDLLKAARAVQHSLQKDDYTTFMRRDNARQLLTTVDDGIGLSWFVSPLAFGHGGSNNPGWRCMLLAYANLPWNRRAQRELDLDDDDDESDYDHGHATAPDMSGIAVMTNSATGDFVVRRVMHAIAYLQGWPEPSTYFAAVDAWIPFPAPIETELDERWKEWAEGPWPNGWLIREDEEVGAVAGVAADLLMPLRPAAIPAKLYSNNRRSIDVLLDGTWIMLRFGWHNNDRIIEVWNGNLSTTQVLRKTKARHADAQSA